MSGRRLLDPATVAPDIRPLEVRLVGAYGLRIGWSDGHATGIYTFERLRRECPCARCTGLREI
jgi:ATP-binding protein involved in chromosome partitioning